MSYTLIRLSQFIITVTFLKSILIPLQDIIRPKYITLVV